MGANWSEQLEKLRLHDITISLQVPPSQHARLSSLQYAALDAPYRAAGGEARKGWHNRDDVPSAGPAHVEWVEKLDTNVNEDGQLRTSIELSTVEAVSGWHRHHRPRQRLARPLDRV